MEGGGIWILAAIGAIALAEALAGRHKGIYHRRDVAVGVLTFVGGLALRPLVAVTIAAVLAALIPGGKGALSSVPVLPALIAILLVGEFVNYWVHRLSHEKKGSALFDWLWRMHRTHHTAKYVNVLLNFRLSIFWAFVSGLNWVFALAIYLGQPKAIGIAIIIFSAWGIATHSHFRWDDAIRRHRVFGRMFRALEHIVISSGIHHSHHGFGKDGGNFRNFGVLLSIYDWMFGTLHIPQGRPFRYGIPGQQPHWIDDVVAPFSPGSWLTKYRNRAQPEA